MTTLAGRPAINAGAGYVEELGRVRSAPTVKLRLAAVRHLFDWLVVGQVLSLNSAASVRGPSHSVRRGKTPVLAPTEARQLLDSSKMTTPAGLRDQALIGLMIYSLAWIRSALATRVDPSLGSDKRRLRHVVMFPALSVHHRQVGDFLTAHSFGKPQLVELLQIEPELTRRAEKSSQPECGIAGQAALTVQDAGDPVDWNLHLARQRVAECIEVVA